MCPFTAEERLMSRPCFLSLRAQLSAALLLSTLSACATAGQGPDPSDEAGVETGAGVEGGAPAPKAGESDPLPLDMELPEPDMALPVPDMALPESDMELPEPDMELPEPDMELPEPDMELPEPDMELPEPDMELPEPDMELPEPDMELLEPDMEPLAVCGDGLVEGEEECDDGNTNLERCAYNQRSCVVCDPSCQERAGEVSYCGDGVLDFGELCDAGEGNSDTLPYGCRTDCHPDYRDALIPFLQDSYIVQGVASSCESLETQDCEDERLYLSLYFKNAAGEDASDNEHADKRSLIVELNPNSALPFAITRCWELSGELARSHVGGAAFAQTTSGARYVYVSAASKIERYRLPSQAEAPELNAAELSYGSLDSCAELGGAGQQAWPVMASSYLSHVIYQGQDYLFVGDFCTGSGCAPRVYGYELDMSTGSIDNSAPDLTFVTREKAQGVDVHEDYIYVSVSYGDNDSYIYQDRLSAALCSPTGCTGARNEQVRRVEVKGGVAGGEDLARVGSHLWSASESGSRHFQNRPLWDFPWSSYFPYLYDLPLGASFESPSTSVGDAVSSRHARGIVDLLANAYENWWDDPERIRVMDVNGDGRGDIVIGPQASDGCWYILEGSADLNGRGQLIDRGCVVQGYEGWHDNTDRIRVMDVNGDSRDDIVIGPYSADGCWYVLQGQSTSAGASFIDRGCVEAYKGNWHDKSERIRALDVNGDGADDIVIGPASSGNWYIMQGRVGTVADFSAGRTMSVGAVYGGWWDNPERVRVIDANGDGRQDIIIGPYSVDGCWYILQGTAGGDFIDRGCVRQAEGDWYDAPERIWIEDFTGEGKEDVLLGPSGVNGCWYLLPGTGSTSASLGYEGCVHVNYENWWDNHRRIRLMRPQPNAPAAVLIGPKTNLGEWQLLQGHSGRGLFDKQWAVNLKEEWGEEDGNQRPERIWVIDLNGDERDDIVIGPSSAGNWYLVEGR